VTACGGVDGCSPYGCGVLYELNRNGTLKVLHDFAGGASDGCGPYGSVLQDRAGNFYGTTNGCGSNGGGTIWKVSRKGKETILHNFSKGPSDGCGPYAGVARDSKGNLYGVTSGCGADNWGTLYKLSASGTLTLLHSFGYQTDGSVPVGEVLRTAEGRLYGTAASSGAYGCGTVWSYVL
jgi:uncharacterized repeat protein (TIGR03803 family)